MKQLPLHTLVLLAVFLHSGSCSDDDRQCGFEIVHVGETVTIKCSITNPQQDGVYMYRRYKNSTKEKLSYYYKDGTFTPREPNSTRLKTNGKLSDFSVSISSVHHNDTGVYWCKFNKRDSYTISACTVLIVLPNIQVDESCNNKEDSFMYLIVIAVLLIIILILMTLLVSVWCKHGHYMPKQHASNGVYEVMRGNTPKALINSSYESTQRRSPPGV